VPPAGLRFILPPLLGAAVTVRVYVIGVGAGVSGGAAVVVGTGVSCSEDEGTGTAGAGELTQAPSKTTQIIRVIKRAFVFIEVLIPEFVMQFSTI
jgi:hypothetical protein